MSKGKAQWVQWDPSKVKTVMRRGPHQMTQKLLHWRYCARCGLLNLKNDSTRRALKRECVTEEEA